MLPRLLVILLGWITASSAYAQVTLLEEDFDGTGAPIGWTLETGWDLHSASASPGSGGNNLRHSGDDSTSALIAPVDLSSATSASLTFLARRTGSYGADNLAVTASADGGSTFPVTLLSTAVPAADSKWESMAVDLPSELLGSPQVVIRFEGKGRYASSANARIDDVTITAFVPVEITPATLSFVAPVGGSEARSFTATNKTAERVTIAAPVLSGPGFSITPSSSVELAAGAEQAYEVTFEGTSRGVYDGSVRIDYGLGSYNVALSGTVSGGLLAFGTASSEAVGGETGFAVPLHLEFTSAAGLQGLQFRVDWSGAVPVLSGVARGSAISSTTDWSLTYEAGSSYVEVVLLGEGSASLAGGTYDDLISLLFDFQIVASSTSSTLTIGSVIGALAEAEGSDADLSASADSHVIAIEPAKAYFDPSASSLDAGDVPIGETASVTLTISNPGGNSALAITQITSSNDVFSVSPATAEIDPDAAEDFAITFSPTTTSFGRQNAEITFSHSGDAGTSAVSVTGKGRGGRGDAEGDGTVDALDVVHAIDFVLNRLTPDAAQKAAADLFPFPAGDSDLDVRDLTVLSQAIVRGRWPDEVELPAEESAVAKSGGSGVRLTVDPALIEMTHAVPIRAFQIVLPASAHARADLLGGEGASLVFGAGIRPAIDPSAESEHELRVLVYKADGGVLAPGVIRLATMGVSGRPRYVTVIGETRERLRLDESIWTSAEEALSNTVLPQKPYPNPFRPGVDELRHSPDLISFEVFDVLGRLVHRKSPGDSSWTGADNAGRAVPPGVYLFAIRTRFGAAVFPVVVIR